MKFPYPMLRDLVETKLNAHEIGDLLTMAGFELEGIDEVEGDQVLDIKVMSNRGDGLCVFGLAREVLAKDSEARETDLYQSLTRPEPPTASAVAATLGNVTIETSDCTRYARTMFEGVTPQASPEWLQQRLRQSGMRPLGLIVDISNYVMLELGQPLHAFDFDTLAGGRIVVRKARAGERLVTLNGVEHALREDQMMICDAERPVAAAGIMGGLDTEVTDATRTILLESAHFVNTSVRRTRKQMGLSTEASYRFERSVDPNGVVRALHRFADLYAKCGGSGRLVGDVLDVYPCPPAPVTLSLRMSRVVRLLGMDVSHEEAKRYLTALGFEVSESEAGVFSVLVPTWRPDVVREDDLVEEVGRVHGFDRIPETLPHGATTRGGLDPMERGIWDVRQRLLRAGFSQVMSHTLRDTHPLDAPGQRVGPRNPGSPELALLRNSTWPSLADAARRNGGRDLQLFETGRVFEPDERRVVGLLAQGAIYPTDWQGEHPPAADFFSLKGVVDALAPRAVLWRVPETLDPRLHPTRQAVAEGVGVLGVIHPDVAEACGLPSDTVLAELDLETLAALVSAPVHYRPISRNPAVRRDIAVLIDRGVPYAVIEASIRQACGDVLERLWLFDVYTGKGIPEGKHSLAIALQLRKMGENFTDEEANEVRALAVEALTALGGSIR